VLAPERNRGGMLSALYLLGYPSMGALALALGPIATTRGLSFSVDLGAAAIILTNFAPLVRHDDAIHHIPFHRSSFIHVAASPAEH
jgi:hypothetical protein